MTNWMPTLRPGQGPWFQQIAEAMIHDVRAGILRPGDVLPPQRLLADLLGVHLSTVTRAYGLVERHGLIAGQRRCGTVVLDRVHAARLFAPEPQEDLIDLSTNVPAQNPRDRALDVLLGSMLQEQGVETWMRYRSSAQWQAALADGADWLTLCGLAPDRFSVLLCAGAQHALDQALALSHAGRDVAVECYTYPGVKALATLRGLQLHSLQMDGEGVLPASLTAVAQRGVRVAVVSPNLQNPTGACMGLARRQALAEVAARHDLLLIEEDVYGLLAAERLPPLAALLPARTLYVTSLSKTVAPGLRFGLLAVPPALAPPPDDAIHHTGWHMSPLMLALGCRMIRSGEAQRRLAWQRKEMLARNRLLDRALGVDGGQHSACPHRWLRLGEGTSPAAMVARLHRAGLQAVNGDDLAVGRPTVSAIRLALGAAVSRRQLERAAALLQQALSSVD
ncbi:PLP-dependent aminotransferase family protein [Paludibacterium purpuratum]|uniref:Putative 8-amino-7-oxononanoate synthase n=1 Tax=Paludibacterium purpuratum TaxID=1144873 RepID=A0A4R7B447_9NEIS|nr:PLP-dependent aminotransferase family protein [Paludibacterium purpuratum]TDR78341.1 GntR family transcriptional regulator [Paludibacterium purpuratum]